jgi:excisionase family DNA binding protein
MQLQEVRQSYPTVCDSDRTLYVNNVATRLGLSRRTVRHLAKIGALRAEKRGRKIWQFRSADVDVFKARREADRV